MYQMRLMDLFEKTRAAENGFDEGRKAVLNAARKRLRIVLADARTSPSLQNLEAIMEALQDFRNLGAAPDEFERLQESIEELWKKWLNTVIEKARRKPSELNLTAARKALQAYEAHEGTREYARRVRSYLDQLQRQSF
jgi:hypothetical protein